MVYELHNLISLIESIPLLFAKPQRLNPSRSLLATAPARRHPFQMLVVHPNRAIVHLAGGVRIGFERRRGFPVARDVPGRNLLMVSGVADNDPPNTV